MAASYFAAGAGIPTGEHVVAGVHVAAGVQQTF